MKWWLNWKMGKPPERTENQKHYDMVLRHRRTGPGAGTIICDVSCESGRCVLWVSWEV